MELDALDAKILRLLVQDARLSFRDLAEKTGSSVPTVAARVRALEGIGVIRGYRAVVNAGSSGAPLVVANVQTTPKEAARVLARVAELDGAEEALLLSGGHVLARIRLAPPERTLRTLHETLADMPGVVSYEAREVLASAAPDAAPGVPTEVAVPCHQCKGPIHGAPVRKAFEDRVHVFCCRQCLGDFAARREALAARAAKTRRS